jgi:hypothetical protein
MFSRVSFKLSKKKKVLTELEPVWTHGRVKSSRLRDGKEGTRKASSTTPHGIFSFLFQDTHAHSAIELPFELISFFATFASNPRTNPIPASGASRQRRRTFSAGDGERLGPAPDSLRLLQPGQQVRTYGRESAFPARFRGFPPWSDSPSGSSDSVCPVKFQLVLRRDEGRVQDFRCPDREAALRER